MVEQCIHDLRYGSIAINAWTATVYGIDGCTWGAYPGEPLHDLQSGIGIVRNAFMLQNVQKSVLRSSFVHAAQLTVSDDGSFPLTARQFQSISDVIVKPNMKNIMKVGWDMCFSRS